MAEGSIEEITKDLENLLENFTKEKVEEYLKADTKDTKERLLNVAANILVNRHRYEYNLITYQLSNHLSNNTLTEEDEELEIAEFNQKWFFNKEED